MITRREKELLVFIHHYIAEHGIAPSYDEMLVGIGLKSKSGIHRLAHGLASAGYIRMLENRARAIEIVYLPDEYVSTTRALGEPDRLIYIPVKGRIAAGVHLSTVLTDQSRTQVPIALARDVKSFALYMRGDSMVDAGILDGDMLIFGERQFFTGDIVLAAIDRQEATVKRVRRRGAMFALEAANPAYETRLLSEDRIEIMGTMIGLTRRF